MPVRPVHCAYELDAAWIVALWLAIHGSHPSPEVVAARAIAALAQNVGGTAQQSYIFDALKAQFEELGVTVTEQSKHEYSAKAPLEKRDDGEAREFRIHQYCFKFEGATICTQLPVLTHLRTAA